MLKNISFCLLSFLVHFTSTSIMAQVDVSSFPAGCRTIQPSHFRAITLVEDMDQPSEIDIAGDGRVFFTERALGNVKVWDPKLGTSVLVAHFDQISQQEFGLVSVVLDPQFNQNNWVYIWHSPIEDKDGMVINDAGNNTVRKYLLERFTLEDNQFNLATRKVILEVPFRQETHNGASMRFGPDGLFYLATGDNAGARAYGPNVWQNNSPHDGGMTTANTNDLRGKILRLRLIRFPDNESPLPGVGTTYEIPQGNLVHTYATMYTQEELALIRPEIYTMGHRNLFRINVDVNNWVLFGENGPGAANSDPQGPNGFDEWNVATQATFFGWPFFNGQNNPYRPWDEVNQVPMTNSVYDALPGAKSRNGYEMNAFYDANNPVNFSPRNTGVVEMPPIKAAIMGQPRGSSGTDPFPSGLRAGLGYCTPLGGPVYRYFDYYDINGTSPEAPSKVKLPPWFDGRWFIYDDVVGPWMMVEMDSSGNSVDKIYDAPIKRTDFPVNRVLDMEIGPDGALYLMNYGNGNEHSGNTDASIVRVEYIGPNGNSEECYFPEGTYGNPSFLQEPPGVVEVLNRVEKELPPQIGLVNLKTTSTLYLENAYKVEIFNLSGKKLSSVQAKNGENRVKLPTEMAQGLVFLKIYRTLPD